jgi:predicted dehydrogenase
MKLKLAVIGARHAHVWGIVDGFRLTKKVEIAAAAEDHPVMRARVAERLPDVPVYADWQKCLDEVKPDIIALVTRNDIKQKVVCECIRRGIGVLADKPVFTRKAWLRKAEALWKKAKRKPAISALLGLRASAPNYALKKMVEKGELGEIAHVYKCRPHRLSPHGRNPWELNNRQNGGVIIDLASHDVDYGMWLIGSKPVEVTAYGKLSRFKELKGFWDNGQIMVRFENGAVLMVEADWLTPDKNAYHGDCRSLVTGALGFAEVLEHLRRLTVTTCAKKERAVRLPKRTFSLYEDFLEQVAGKPCILPAQDIFALHRVLIAADESARRGGAKVRI